MKLGLGLYRHWLTPENYRFAKQAGATHIVAHMVDYFGGNGRIPDANERSDGGWGASGGNGEPWTYEELLALRKGIEAEGLQIAAIENLDPKMWHDVLLDGPKKLEQLEKVKTTVRNMGKAGIPVLGYNFSVAGVWGHVVGPWARGGAESVGFSSATGPEQTPIPNGHVWNMIYDTDAPAGVHPQTTEEQIWARLEEFLHAVVPVAEEAGVRLAAHPDDPPLTSIRGHARLVNQPSKYQKLLDLYPSKSNALEFCQGTIAEMTEGNVYDAIDQYTKQGAIGYVHFRNVRGKVPEYHEVFIDEGDVDMVRAMRIYKKNGYDGVMIPDHTPRMICDAPWHAGMAYALGYMRGIMRMLDEE
jgi:mannonate dehydratase